jgi:hypothetical protein
VEASCQSESGTQRRLHGDASLSSSGVEASSSYDRTDVQLRTASPSGGRKVLREATAGCGMSPMRHSRNSMSLGVSGLTWHSVSGILPASPASPPGTANGSGTEIASPRESLFFFCTAASTNVVLLCMEPEVMAFVTEACLLFPAFMSQRSEENHFLSECVATGGVVRTESAVNQDPRTFVPPIEQAARDEKRRHA